MSPGSERRRGERVTAGHDAVVRPRIAVVNSSSFGTHFPEHLERLRRIGTVRRFTVPRAVAGERLGRLLRGYTYIIASVTPCYPRSFFETAGSELRLIARHGIGYDNVDVQAAAEHGVVVTKVPGPYEREAMAEHTVALMLTVVRAIVPADAAVREGRWMERALFMGIELRNRTVGILGIGNIGTRVAEILGRGFGARIVAHDPGVPPSEIRRRGARPVGFEQLISTSDIISINRSLSPDAHHLFDARVFARMKDGVFLVNTARGEFIEPESFARAVRSGKIAGAGFDVVEGEPVTSRTHPFFGLPNVVVVPHIGAYTIESLQRMGDKVVSDVERMHRGLRPTEMVRPAPQRMIDAVRGRRNSS
jgi:phosphoglycerate dehydrogenase-like enzyme